MKQFFSHNLPFELECGEILPRIDITYHTYGNLNEKGDNVVWVFHALTANSDPADWWSGLVGEGKYFDPSRYFIVCANILGSCYGSTGPLSNNPATGQPYFTSFPQVTIRDMVKAHRLLARHLNIREIFIGIGGSMGGYQLMEWAIEDPDRFKNIILLATSAKESAWGIAVHSAQRLAIEADPSWKDDHPQAGKKGLMAARGIGMLTYRNYAVFGHTQTDEDLSKISDFKAESYIRYQGEKLAGRFNVASYHLLTRSMDSHNVGRNRGSIQNALSGITAKTLIISISSDILCPPQEQELLKTSIKNSQLIEIESDYGHDGFLTEGQKIAQKLKDLI